MKNNIKIYGVKDAYIRYLSQYQEHVNDHQKEIVELFNQKGYILGIQGIEELEKAIRQEKEFKPKKYQTNNEQMLKIVEEFIENC